jgi:uncharacterized protein YigE (DUF2233 family)
MHKIITLTIIIYLSLCLACNNTSQKKVQTNDRLELVPEPDKDIREKLNDPFISYIINPKEKNINFYYQNQKQENFKSIQNLKYWLAQKKQKLIFATNGGMYKKDHTPQGLFIQNYKTINPLDNNTGNGNFYMLPNGVFYITKNNDAIVCKTADFKNSEIIKYATQSGPMLVFDGAINTLFTSGSTNMNIRNGVGILPNNKVVFAMSKKEINFYDFAKYFKDLGCKNALYLDGFVSRTYLPEQNWEQVDGDFGVIIGVVR